MRGGRAVGHHDVCAEVPMSTVLARLLWDLPAAINDGTLRDIMPSDGKTLRELSEKRWPR